MLDARPLQAPDRAPLDRGLPRRAARRLRRGRRSPASRSRSCSDPTSTTRRPRYEHLEVVGRRQLPPTRLLRSGAHDRRPVPAARRGGRRGLAGRPRRRGGRRLSRGRGRPAADRLGPAGRGHAARPRAVGAARPPSSGRSRPVRAAPAGAAPARRRGGHRRQRRRRRAPRAGSSASGATGSASSALAPRPVSGRVRDGDRTAPAEVALAARLGLADRYLVFTGRFDARHDLATLLRALASLAAAGRPPDLPEPIGWPPRVLLVGASPDDRASIARAAARRASARRSPTRRACPSTDLAGLVRGARAAILPVVSEAAGLPVDRGASPAGRRSSRRRSGRSPSWSVRPGCWSSRATRSGWPSRWRRSGPTTAVHDRVAARRPRAGRDRRRRTWADVARETRAIYAAVGVRDPA